MPTNWGTIKSKTNSFLNKYRNVSGRLRVYHGEAEEELKELRNSVPEKYPNIDSAVLKKLMISAEELLDKFREGGVRKVAKYGTAGLYGLLWMIGFAGIPMTGGIVTALVFIPTGFLDAQTQYDFKIAGVRQKFKREIIREVENVLDKLNEYKTKEKQEDALGVMIDKKQRAFQDKSDKLYVHHKIFVNPYKGGARTRRVRKSKGTRRR